MHRAALMPCIVLPSACNAPRAEGLGEGTLSSAEGLGEYCHEGYEVTDKHHLLSQMSIIAVCAQKHITSASWQGACLT